MEVGICKSIDRLEDLNRRAAELFALFETMTKEEINGTNAWISSKPPYFSLFDVIKGQMTTLKAILKNYEDSPLSEDSYSLLIRHIDEHIQLLNSQKEAANVRTKIDTDCETQGSEL